MSPKRMTARPAEKHSRSSPDGAWLEGADPDDVIQLAVALNFQVADLVDVFTGRDLRKLISNRR